MQRGRKEDKLFENAEKSISAINHQKGGQNTQQLREITTHFHQMNAKYKGNKNSEKVRA